MMAKPSQTERDRRLRAYELTDNDRDAATLLGNVTPHAFRMWRQRHGLPTKADGRILEPEMWQRRVETLQRCKTISQAAAELGGVTPEALRAWALRNGLLEARHQSDNEELFAAREAMYLEGKSDEEVAAAQGITVESAIQWRQLHLPWYISIRRVSDDLRQAAYNYTANDPEAACCLRMDRFKFREWRVSQGLPAKSTRVWHSTTMHRLRTYVASRTDADAARALGLTASAFAHFRARHNLPVRAHADKLLLERLEDYASIPGDHRLGMGWGADGATAATWRRVHDLPESHALTLTLARVPSLETSV